VVEVVVKVVVVVVVVLAPVAVVAPSTGTAKLARPIPTKRFTRAGVAMRAPLN